MKRNLALLIALTLAVSALSACGSGSKETETESASAAETETTEKETEAAAEEEETESPAENTVVEQPEGYPSKTINWIAPVAAGAAVDLATRALADEMDLGQTIVVENIAGASQTLGTAEAAARDADGYTLLTMANACLISQPLITDVAYSLDDFRYIAMMEAAVVTTICVRADSEMETIEDLLDYIENNEFSYGVPNVGGVGHIAIVNMLDQLGVYDKGTMLTYNGSNDNIMAILNGEVDFAIVDDADAISRVESGELRALVALYDQPSSIFKEELPVISDYGVENMNVCGGLKILAIRSDTPDEIVEWIKLKANEAIQSEGYQKYWTDKGMDAVREYTEEEINELIDNYVEEWGIILRKVGLAE